MSTVSEIITQDQIQDLWGCGFTIVARRRHPDPFHVPQDMVPQGRSYQWWHLVHDKCHFGGPSSAWAPVPASRHDGYFMPFGHVGDIEVGGLGLFEKSKVGVDQERAQQVADAMKPMQDWANNVKSLGFEGGAAIFDGGGRVVEKYDDETRISTIMPLKTMENHRSKTIESTVKIPSDMAQHMAAIFAERGRLCSDLVMEDRRLRPSAVTEKFYAAVDADKSLPWWPTLHAILLPIAIENVRKSLKQESAS